MNLLGALLILLVSLHSCTGQKTGEECLAEFKRGREDFVLDADESVKDGATFISSPKLDRYRDCVVACCKQPKCNVAFMERGEGEGTIKSCFLFDCLYKKKYACRFVRKKGYVNYILDSVYESYLEVNVPTSKIRNIISTKLFKYSYMSGDLSFFSFLKIPKHTVWAPLLSRGTPYLYNSAASVELYNYLKNSQ